MSPEFKVLPTDELLLIYLPVFWGIGFGVGWTVAWVISKPREGDYHDWQTKVAYRSAAVFFWIYLLTWAFGYVEL